LLYINAHPQHEHVPFSTAPCLAFAPDGKTLASAGSDRIIHLWDPTTGKDRGQYQGPSGFTGLAFGPDGKALITSGSDTTVLIWDATKPPPKPNGNKGTITLH